jgi:hypothetical protein
VYAIRQLPEQLEEIAGDEFPYGVNMAIRREALDGFQFNPRVGPTENTQLRGEEVELIQRFQRNGYRGRWVHTARVRHYIPAERLTAKYLWNYYVGASRTQERLGAGAARQQEARLFGRPRWALKQYALQQCQRLLRAPLKDDAWLTALHRAAWAKGILQEAAS